MASIPPRTTKRTQTPFPSEPLKGREAGVGILLALLVSFAVWGLGAWLFLHFT